jgi:hypothetical protein
VRTGSYRSGVRSRTRVLLGACLQDNPEARYGVECCTFGTQHQRAMARSLWRPHATRRSPHDLMQLATQDGARAVSIVLCGAAFVMMVRKPSCDCRKLIHSCNTCVFISDEVFGNHSRIGPIVAALPTIGGCRSIQNDLMSLRLENTC